MDIIIKVLPYRYPSIQAVINTEMLKDFTYCHLHPLLMGALNSNFNLSFKMQGLPVGPSQQKPSFLTYKTRSKSYGLLSECYKFYNLAVGPKAMT